MLDKYPDDIELKILVAKELYNGYNYGELGETDYYAKTMLERIILEDSTAFAAHHFYIHLMEEGPYPEQALRSAKALESLAKGSSHIQHMPGHIYFRLGMYDKAREAFTNAYNLDIYYNTHSGVDPLNNWNYFHNVNYFTLNCAEDGHYKQAVEMTRIIENIEFGSTFSHRSVGVIEVTISDMQLAWRVGNWQDCIDWGQKKMNDKQNLGGGVSYLRSFVYHFALGMQAYENKDWAKLDSIIKVHSKLMKRGNIPKETRKSGGYKFMKKMYASAYQKELMSLQQIAKGDFEKAHQLVDEAIATTEYYHSGDPPIYPRYAEETKVEIYIAEGKYEAAIELLKEMLKYRRGSPHTYLKLAEIYSEFIKNKELAKEFVDKALLIWRDADEDFAPFVRAQKLKKELP